MKYKYNDLDLYFTVLYVPAELKLFLKISFQNILVFENAISISYHSFVIYFHYKKDK